jgi:hydrogenase maturation protease
VLVIGIGSEPRGDDAAGLEAVRRLRAGDGIESALCLTGALELLELWRGAPAVLLVDAVRSGSAPGTMHRFEVGTQPLDCSIRLCSSHAIGVGEAVELARVLGRLPPRLVIYGIEAAGFQPGTGLSDPVAASLPRLVRAMSGEAAAIRDELTRATTPLVRSAGSHP